MKDNYKLNRFVSSKTVLLQFQINYTNEVDILVINISLYFCSGSSNTQHLFGNVCICFLKLARTGICTRNENEKVYMSF